MNDCPKPRSFIVSGRLDEIKHGNGRFRLVVGQGSALLGRVDPTSLDVEALRPLWGKHATVEGIVHFKVNGQPRLIEARRICVIKEEISSSKKCRRSTLRIRTACFLFHGRKRSAFDPIELAGAWPGDEPIEQLLAQLD